MSKTLSDEVGGSSPWDRWKHNLGDVRPWDFLSINTEYTTDEVANKRYEICLSCPFFMNITKQCTKCGCFMAAKTKLQKASCPIEKW